MNRGLVEAHTADPNCGCNHGRSVHFKHPGCKSCKTDFCHVAGCGCMTFTPKRTESPRWPRKRK